jgi:hypothetical protein
LFTGKPVPKRPKELREMAAKIIAAEVELEEAKKAQHRARRVLLDVKRAFRSAAPRSNKSNKPSKA